MINSIFFGYLSPQWKRLVRTIVILNLALWVFVMLRNYVEYGFYEELPIYFNFIVASIFLNIVLSYVFELFVKKKQSNEVGLSILCLLINLGLMFIVFYAGGS